ncbi:hypothetical protein M2146_002546 [Lachnospiraceae bacterium PF1-22]
MDRWTKDTLKEISDLDFAIAILNERKNKLNCYSPLSEKINKTIRKLEVLKTDYWRSVEDSLPSLEDEDDFINVHVCLDDGYVCTVSYTADGFELWADSGDVVKWKYILDPDD